MFLEHQQTQTKNQTLEFFLIKPLQRICKYPLLLSELLKHTTREHPDYAELVVALDNMKETVLEINEMKRATENAEELLSGKNKEAITVKQKL